MKIGIITHPIINNYGGILQNYALQQVLIELGHDVYTIDRIPTTPIKIKTFSFGKRFLLMLKGKSVKLRGWLTKEESDLINRNTRSFVKGHIKLTESFSQNSKINQIHQKYMFDAYIVGSDQVWRRSSVRGNNLEFLDFLKNNNQVKKIAYSASFGVSNWEFTKKETERFKDLIQFFDGVSVREDDGVVMCKKFLNVDAKHLIDPSMLLSKEKYLSLLKKRNFKQDKERLFVYVLDRNQKKNDIINGVSEAIKLKGFEVMPSQSFALENEKSFDLEKCIFPEVEQWIEGFANAEFVITDSFHGTAFSVIFNKPFLAIINEKRGASRFYSLLKTFGLENRLITENSSNFLEVAKTEIDFSDVNKILELEKEKSIRFLNDILND
ncbi:polysaccharide pyruvyl transferase family protein [Mongoliibacter ruber]|uniref:Polysaccharide pyruvyl transferase n=1 Tax=Mongoliibacter ruber TaxID=1750599 RepID=A0A2T0WNU1_9BACT|nr:polysaccharide pyruvyl transferase family protein [Mongoliibacter ruber]PRY88367.1 polysaccharide pyruvyl transferase [Mongoliibacter ruber]